MLDQIVADVRSRIPALQSRARAVRAAARDAPPVRDFGAALAAGGLAVISEIKRASPSRGVLNPDLVPVDQALQYQAGGAAAISVLTEPEYFRGSEADLRAVRAGVEIPVLRKDFTVDETQIWEARAMGADAILLIVAILTPVEIRRFLDAAGEAGVAALVEAHTQAEAITALEAGAQIVGVNNRDLATFDVSLSTAEAIAPILGDAAIRVAESGIFTGTDAARMRAAGYDAVLVGESLVRSGDPAQAVRELREAGS